MDDFLFMLINAAEKSANIARVIRTDSDLFSMLVEEKKEEDKNKRFFRDFKTLADVLIQETVRHDIRMKYPELAYHIHGEEDNKFTNTLGETIKVEVKEFEDETALLLTQVLDGNSKVGRILANVVHQDITLQADVMEKTSYDTFEVTNLGIWIDPIDSTAEYITGHEMIDSDSQIYQSGLCCVTVLVGVFNRITGQPVLGVVNQPFHSLEAGQSRWTGQYFFGIAYEDFMAPSMNLRKEVIPDLTKPRIVVTSSAESLTLQNFFKENGMELVFAAGAGYKLLCVATGLADAYIVSRGTTFKWDSCSPHALLRSLGGGLVNFQACLKKAKSGAELRDNADLDLVYNKADDERLVGADRWSNTGGVIAYRDRDFFIKIFALLKKLPT